MEFNYVSLKSIYVKSIYVYRFAECLINMVFTLSVYGSHKNDEKNSDKQVSCLTLFQSYQITVLRKVNYADITPQVLLQIKRSRVTIFRYFFTVFFFVTCKNRDVYLSQIWVFCPNLTRIIDKMSPCT